MSRSYWENLVDVKHPSMRGLEHLVRRTLENPIEIRRSKSDPAVRLFYGEHDLGLLCCTVVRFLNGDGFIITAYLTKRTVGEIEWKQNA